MLLIEPYQLQKLIDPLSSFLRLLIQTEILHSLRNDTLHRHTGIQRCIGILEYHLRPLFKPDLIILL